MLDLTIYVSDLYTHKNHRCATEENYRNRASEVRLDKNLLTI